jgi:hypothetical protein
MNRTSLVFLTDHTVQNAAQPDYRFSTTIRPYQPMAVAALALLADPYSMFGAAAAP